MANECDFYMKVKGKEEAVMEFADILKDRYREKGIYFNGISDADIIAEESDADGILKVEIAGYCAWSVYSCMRKGECTYYGTTEKESGTYLEKESARLHLDIEVYSEEPGLGFQEHVLIRNGIPEADECVDYREISPFLYESYEDFLEDTDTGMSEEEFKEYSEDGTLLYEGGFENYREFVL